MDYLGAGGLEFGGGNLKLDPIVLRALPTGCRVVGTEVHGVSFWADTGRIDVVLEDGSCHSYLINVISGEIGRKMVESEYEATAAIYTIVPEFATQPLAWGTYETVKYAHFYLCDFHKMINDMPDPYVFTSHLARLHQNSESPTGKFGFHMTTYNGRLPQLGGWESSWETYFTNSLKLALDLEAKAKGTDAELERLLPVLFEKVIPRLLRPLESEGRSIKPSLVHGDLWCANSGIDVESGEPLVFDACSFYAHNEYEFGQWRPICNRFGEEYLKAYRSRVPISAPEEDYDGRLDLYKLRFNTHVSALFEDDHLLRDQMLGDIRDLVDRYG